MIGDEYEKDSERVVLTCLSVCYYRVRKEEMLFLLKQSIQLKLQENIMTLNDDDSKSKFYMSRKAK